MINFVVPRTSYQGVIKSFIIPILPFLEKYQISDKAYDGCVNVIFFTEDSLFKKFNAEKGKGINVFITHGIADKNWRNANSTDKFDYVFITGSLWLKKLVSQGMDANKIFIGGYTRLDDLHIQKKTYKKQIDNSKKTILFAPTHNSSVTSYNKMEHLIPLLEEKYNVLISSHPHNNNSKFTTTEFLEADVVVGDFGSSMYEAWSFGKPSVLPSWIVKNDIFLKYKDSFEEKIYMECIGYHSENENHFFDQIDSAICNGITESEVEFIDGIFSKKLRGNSGYETAIYLKKIMKNL